MASFFRAARRRWVLSLFVVTVLAGLAFAEELLYPFPLVLKPGDRVLVLAPHPDDEVLGCGGILQEAVQRKLPLRVVFLTNGDNNELSFLLYRKRPVFMPKAVRQMGEIRRGEALKAAQVLGVPEGSLLFLGYPDWGTLPIWYSHWGRRPPYRSMLTRVRAVPYSEALHPGASYKGEQILADLERVIREFRPTKVFVTHSADGHPDHRAAYLFTRVALWDLRKEIRPRLYPYLVHYRHWPGRVRDPLRAELAPPDSLKQVAWFSYALTPGQAQRKAAALRAHRSQYRSGPRSFVSFVRLNELFGDYTSVAAHREGSDLVITLEFPNPLNKEVSAALYLFGWRSDLPFWEMPKLFVRIGSFHHRLYDQARLIRSRAVTVVRRPNQITVRIPLEMLGAPEKILSSAHTTLGNVSIDWVSWRVLDLPR